ncbi:Uncharacterised protein [Hungatella hathewayi]|nr:Uncharacterised protein [Hungatella hathewayi]
MRSGYIKCKKKNVYAIYFKPIHTIYYNVGFIGETQLILFIS